MTGSFDAAARAIVDGDVSTLRALLAREPDLARARSVDGFDATLLHFVAANGVPDELQRSPANAPEVAAVLLGAGADPDALCGAYGGGSNQTPLCLLVSSWPPYERGVQGALVRTLVDGGATVDGVEGDGAPLTTALVFGYTSAAEALVEAGARTEGLFHAAGVGDARALERAFVAPGQLAPDALGPYAPVVEKALDLTDDAALVQEALHFAITHERLEAAEMLLGHGASVDGRTTGHHCELPLVQAVFVQSTRSALWLLDRGADPDLVDGKRGASAREHVARAGPPDVAARLTGL